MTAMPSHDTAPVEDRWEGTGFRPDIQGLRAIAVMLVLLSHAGFAAVAGGYVGVDVFFVVSGFLITSLLVQEMFTTGSISLAEFFARRARRILPAATVVTVATAIGAWLWFPITRFESVMTDAVAVIAYVVNYRFVIETTQYLNADALPSPFQQYWSLAVEEQFYLVWPLALLCLFLAVRRRPRVALRAATVFVVIAFVVSLIASIVITASSQPTAYYATHTRVWELAGGAFLALTLPWWRKVGARTATACAALGLGSIVASGFAFGHDTAFPGYAALAPVLGTMLLIVAGTAHGSNLVSALISTAPFQFIGKISYSLYLWHWPILVLGPMALGVEPSLRLNLMLLTAAFPIAQLSYEWIETPIRNARSLKLRSRNGLATGGVCAALGLAAVVVLSTGLSKVPDEREVDLAAVSVAPDVATVQEDLRAGLQVRTVPTDLQPGLAHVDKDQPEIYANGCHLGFGPTTAPGACAYGDVDATTTVVLFGDSHAAQWFPALDSIATEQGWRLLSRTKSSCSPVSVTVASSTHEGEYEECTTWRANVLDEIDEIKPALVIIGATDEEEILDVTGDGAAEWGAGWTTTLDRVTASAGRVAALTDTPRATGKRAPDCLALNEDDVRGCVKDQPYEIGAPARREAGIAAQREEGVTVVGTKDWFCVDGGCPFIVDDTLVYRDQHHISTVYAQFLSKVLFRALPRLG